MIRRERRDGGEGEERGLRKGKKIMAEEFQTGTLSLFYHMAVSILTSYCIKLFTKLEHFSIMHYVD